MSMPPTDPDAAGFPGEPMQEIGPFTAGDIAEAFTDLAERAGGAQGGALTEDEVRTLALLTMAADVILAGAGARVSEAAAKEVGGMHTLLAIRRRPPYRSARVK